MRVAASGCWPTRLHPRLGSRLIPMLRIERDLIRLDRSQPVATREAEEPSDDLDRRTCRLRLRIGEIHAGRCSTSRGPQVDPDSRWSMCLKYRLDGPSSRSLESPPCTSMDGADPSTWRLNPRTSRRPDRGVETCWRADSGRESSRLTCRPRCRGTTAMHDDTDRASRSPGRLELIGSSSSRNRSAISKTDRAQCPSRTRRTIDQRHHAGRGEPSRGGTHARRNPRPVVGNSGESSSRHSSAAS